MPDLERLDVGARAKILDALHRDGACIVLNALDIRVCESLLEDFEPHLDQVAWGANDLGYQDDFHGVKTKRLHGLFSKSAAMGDVLTNPFMLRCAAGLLIDSAVATDLRLSNAELMVLGKSQGAQMFHTDAASWPRAQKLDDHELLVSVNYALTDFTHTNGATRVVPGSHHWDSGREPTADEICLATMPRGSALVYTGSAVHSGGANEENELRVGLYLGYIASWLRPIENQLITNRPEDIFALPEDAQRLLDVVPGGITIYP